MLTAEVVRCLVGQQKVRQQQGNAPGPAHALSSTADNGAYVDRTTESDLLGLYSTQAKNDTYVKQKGVGSCVLSSMTDRKATKELRQIYKATKIDKNLYQKQLQSEYDNRLNVNHNPVHMFQNCSKARMNASPMIRVQNGITSQYA